jgi:hypothetical protein
MSVLPAGRAPAEKVSRGFAHPANGARLPGGSACAAAAVTGPWKP